jgi:hypothetical protein
MGIALRPSSGRTNDLISGSKGAIMRRRLVSSFAVAVALAFSATSVEALRTTVRWPSVSPVARTFHFVDHQQPEARLIIRAPGGEGLYLLECYLNAYERPDPQFDYSGAFECRLISTTPAMNEGYSTLLTDQTHPTRDWESRGRFLLQEITGQCATYPEWGAVRHFRLRGMALTLAVSNVKVEAGSRVRNQPWGVDRIQSLDLNVDVAADPRALPPVSEPTRYAEPPYAHPDNPEDLSRDCGKALFRSDEMPTVTTRKIPR